MKELADALPNARHVTLPGQTHMVKAAVLAPVLIDFFANSITGRADSLAYQVGRN